MPEDQAQAGSGGPSEAAAAALKAAQAAIASAKAAQAPAAGAAGAAAPAPAHDDAADTVAQAMAEVAATQAATGARPLSLESLGGPIPGVAKERIDLLGDVNLNVKIELGRTKMLVEDVLRLSAGAVVELDKLAGDPVDVYVNDRPVARGEVLVLNDNFCIRISEIIASPHADGGAPEARQVG